MTRKTGKIENINFDLGEIVLYQSEDGQAALDVHLKDDRLVDSGADGEAFSTGSIGYFQACEQYFQRR